MSSRQQIFHSCLAIMLLSGLAGSHAARAEDAEHHDFDAGDIEHFSPGNLVISRVIYDNNPKNVLAGVTLLPPNCTGSACVTATAGGAYPYVWNNALADGSFGITAKIVLDQLGPTGRFINSLEVPNASRPRGPAKRDQMVGSFSSKSEDALNLSTDGRYVTFMGYLAPVNALDASNSNTPGVVDLSNPVSQQYFRVVAQVDAHGKFRFTEDQCL